MSRVDTSKKSNLSNRSSAAAGRETDSHELELLLGDEQSPSATSEGQDSFDLHTLIPDNPRRPSPRYRSPKSRYSMKWLSPFKRYKLEDFDSVYVPLNQAIRHPDVVAENKKRASAGILVDDSDVLTLESLRAEIEADIGLLDMTVLTTGSLR